LRPYKLGSLPTTEFALPHRRDKQHFRLLGIGNLAFSNESISFSNKQIPCVQRDRHAVFGMEGRLIVATVIFILDIIMNE
jgi:hypothetical protein